MFTIFRLPAGRRGKYLPTTTTKQWTKFKLPIAANRKSNSKEWLYIKDLLGKKKAISDVIGDAGYHFQKISAPVRS